MIQNLVDISSPQKEDTTNAMQNIFYRKIGICSRGYYYFWWLFGAASNQGRLLFEGGYYSNFTNLTIPVH